jgi:hypothetical protein
MLMSRTGSRAGRFRALYRSGDDARTRRRVSVHRDERGAKADVNPPR